MVHQQVLYKKTATATTSSGLDQTKDNLSLPGTTSKKMKRKPQDDRVDEAYKFISDVKQKMEKRDDYAAYGENVSNIIRNSKQSYRAICIAKHHIDNILFKLEMGEYQKIPRNPIAFRQTPDHLSYSSHLSSPYMSPTDTSDSQSYSQLHMYPYQPQATLISQQVNQVLMEVNSSLRKVMTENATTEFSMGEFLVLKARSANQ